MAYIACTWLGRVALVSAASRAKSTTLSSEPQRASPIPLSITLNPDERMSWWARRNRLANSRMMVKLCKAFDMTDFFTLCSPFDFQHLTLKYGIRDTCSTADIFIHFHPLSSTFVNFHPDLYIHFHPHLSNFIHFHPFPVNEQRMQDNLGSVLNCVQNSHKFPPFLLRSILINWFWQRFPRQIWKFLYFISYSYLKWWQVVPLWEMSRECCCSMSSDGIYTPRLEQSCTLPACLLPCQSCTS